VLLHREVGVAVVRTIEDKCIRCYNCVHNCPAKAIQVRHGKAEVIEERCIACGTCLRVCAHGAKEVRSDIEPVTELLEDGRPVFACLDPSFPVAFPDIQPGQIVAAVRALGFDTVVEAAFGGELVAARYAELARQKQGRTLITSSCPVIVSLIEKHFTGLIKYLVPLVSPMIATARLVKEKINADAAVVFIGPCIGRKEEMNHPDLAEAIDSVLTFDELRRMWDAAGIEAANLAPEDTASPRPSAARALAVSGGLLKVAGIETDLLDSNVLVTEGGQRVLEILESKEHGAVTGKLLDIMFCRGCIDGPVTNHQVPVPVRKDILCRYVLENDEPSVTAREVARFGGVDLKRGFVDRSVVLPLPRKEDVEAVLAKIGKLGPVRQMECGCCGYSGCRDWAIAVCQGIAGLEMCLPYMVRELERLNTESKLWQVHRDMDTLRNKLAHSERLVIMGQLAASVAHEINNPLSVILTYAKLLKKKIARVELPGSDVRDLSTYLETMQREVERSGTIVRSLLDFARQNKPMLRSTEVVGLVNEAMSLVRNQMRLRNIEARTQLSPVPPIIADFAQLQQALVNVLLNGIQAMDQGGTISVSTSFDEPAQSVEVRISDNGCGIPQSRIEHIFDPFYTTKEKGTGLGLSVAYGIVSRHGGSMEVSSTPGEGTTFAIRLPLEANASAMETQVGSPFASRGHLHENAKQ
jgi:two-component system NtrC family sensor kinase